MAGRAPSWRLEKSVAEATQGIVRTGFASLGVGAALFLEFPAETDPATDRAPKIGGAWLADLQANYPATAAIKVGSHGTPGESGETDLPGALDHAVSMAFTCTGLERMGLAPEALASFSTPFREGMFQEDRLRRLGDRRGDVWLDTTGGNVPRWSGNTPSRHQDQQPAGAYDGPLPAERDRQIETEVTVHALVLVYAADDPETPDNPILAGHVSAIERILAPHGIKTVHTLPLVLDPDRKRGISREHFGFADGLSQPIPYDKNGAVTLDSKPVNEATNRAQHVPLGEFLMGYLNGHQEPALGPVVAAKVAGLEEDLPASAGVPKHRSAEGFYDIGINGSYLVVRELSQNVPAFWQSMDKAAGLMSDADPAASDIDATWLAEKVVGRTVDGDVLRPKGPLKRKPGNQPDNDFLFYDADKHGVGCPLGSHVRRAHPRDTLAPDPSQKQTLLNAANNHRILRRARKYGPKIEDPRVDDEQDRGLLFMCLNTDIARQFEFVQQTWLFNSDFATLYEEVDPLIGSDGSMTIPENGLRRRAHVETFVHMVGGEYFFLPSIPTLNYLTKL